FRVPGRLRGAGGGGCPWYPARGGATRGAGGMLLLAVWGTARFSGAPEGEVITLSQGRSLRVVETRHSFYGDIKVVDFIQGVYRHRNLLIDGLTQGGVDPEGLSVVTYPYFICFLGELLQPRAESALVIGLGAGIVPGCLDNNGVRAEVVEIDPVIVELASRHFAFQPKQRVHIADARYFLGSSTARYDQVVMDAFSGDTTPGHLLNLEAMRLVKARLHPRGVFFINMIDTLVRENLIAASVVKTLGEVFEQVELVPVFDPLETDRVGNIVVIAYDGPLRRPDHDRLNGRRVHDFALESVNRFIAGRFQFPPGTPAMLLTDDFSPFEFHDVWAKEQLRKVILESEAMQRLYRL
ncbi:MAG: fused MFS/spermidine synthase, partial [Magnetococcales bacterium]|nr:fused MFS/spermidine synthase [Magnetococcales bacterium]